ncbi:asparagine synthase (glutamine-hydrolyzing) [Kiloniella majae]|uniref:asparagine synthase (glutamine-hydrolyzing) n=1 Tax=Kiloniella majae TaxID=1938558 RepID=UPI000A279507|nr:asparagine synthase (glutamine-hydrolyzing) [Kiloniella majae]
MCGIFGHTNLNQENIISSHEALHTLSHRGPDSWHHEVKDNVYLGHRRLSILDLSDNGRQPMVTQGVYLTVNGEIYNYLSLREDLIRDHDVNFFSDSDSEVLLHGYIHWGIDKLLDLVDGMFALSIYDHNKNKILLARDHVGIKPLYYCLNNNQFSWASELKALEKFYGVDALTIDATAIYDFMTYLYVPCPKTMYNEVRKLEPGTYLSYDLRDETIEINRYWSLKNQSTKLTPSNYQDYIKSSLHTAVSEQLVSDVPVGFFLSGGVDSSTVCYEASTCLKTISTFSIGHVDKESDESPFAKQVAEKIGSLHQSMNFSQKIANENFFLIKEFYDEPFADVSALPTNEVCKLARQKVTVVLTGDGGDELFGGYRHYEKADWVFAFQNKNISWLRPFLTTIKTYAPHRYIAKKAQRYEVKTITDPMEKWAKIKGGLLKTDIFKRKWAKAHSIPTNYDDYWYYRQYDNPKLTPKTRAQYIDFNTYMHDSVLTKVDRASMAVALETRVPFLSKKMIKAAWAVPESNRYLEGELKGVLKKAYSTVLPKEVLYREKQGFGIGRIHKKDKLYDRTKNLPKQILTRLFPHILETDSTGK